MFLRYIWQLSYTELLPSSTHIVRTVEVNIENHYIKFYVNTRNIRTCTHIKISFSKAVIQTTVLKLNGSKIAGCCIYIMVSISFQRDFYKSHKEFIQLLYCSFMVAQFIRIVILFNGVIHLPMLYILSFK